MVYLELYFGSTLTPIKGTNTFADKKKIKIWLTYIQKHTKTKMKIQNSNMAEHLDKNQ